MLSIACSASRCSSICISKRKPLGRGSHLEHLLEELQQIQQFALLYPPQGEKGTNRVSLVLSKRRWKFEVAINFAAPKAQIEDVLAVVVGR